MPGFIFWGLFLILGLIVAGYGIWMVWVERRSTESGPTERRQLEARQGD